MPETSQSDQEIQLYSKVDCAALGFVLKKMHDGTYRYYYAHKNNTLMDRSKLVVTKDDLVNIKNVLSITDVIKVCAEERANTKWKFHKVTNVTVFAALLRQAPMLCKDAMLQESLTKNHTINCITFEKKTQENRTMSIYSL